MFRDERIIGWAEAECQGTAARRDGDLLRANPYLELSPEAVLHHYWRRGWTQADRELAAEARLQDRRLLAV